MVKLLNIVNVPIYQKGLFLCWNEVLGASAGPLAMLQLSCSRFWVSGERLVLKRRGTFFRYLQRAAVCQPTGYYSTR